jgi:small-conductance mechanosensitive channel
MSSSYGLQGGATAVWFSIVFIFVIAGWIFKAFKTGRSTVRLINPGTSEEKKNQAREHLNEVREGELVQGLKRYTIFMSALLAFLFVIGFFIFLFN